MAPVTMPPVEEAKSIFSRLGYSLSGDGPELVAERKWRTVHVTAIADASTASRLRADGGRDDSDFRYRCFVTWKEYAGDLREHLTGANVDYEWAIIGVDDAEAADYDVVRSGPHAASA